MPDKYFIADTNVIISAALFSSSNPALSLRKIFLSGKLAFSEAILEKYTAILSGNKFDKYIPVEKRLSFLDKLVKEGTLVTVTETVTICRDPKDNKYLELAASCKASCIITGDKDLLVLHPFENIPILTPGEFLNQFF